MDEMLIPNGVTNNTAINYELTGYINNINSEYTQVLTEFGANGGTTNIYEYGASREIATINGTKSYYMYDGRGSVASLTGSSSSNIVSYTYNAYGEESKSGNTLNNPYRYNAEYTDSSTGYQYLRARYYNPATGRFLTKDTYLGTIPNPLSRNLYAYVENNPLNYIDPSGHAPLRTNPMRNMPLISPVDQMKIDNQIANQSFHPLDGIKAATHPGGPKAYYDEKIENVYGEHFFGKGYSNPTSPYRLKTDSSLGYVSNRKEAKTKLQKAIDDRKINLYKTYCENGADRAKDSGTTFSLGPKEYAALALGSIMVAKVGLDDFTSGVISSVADNALYPILFLSGKLSGTEIGSFSEFSNYTFDEAFYVGRIAGDVIGIVVGAGEAMVGITNFITGMETVGTGMPALVSGVASGEGVIVVAAGAVVAVAGAVEVAAGGATIQKSFANLFSDIDAFSSSKSENRIYRPNDGKHKGTPNGNASADPFWNNTVDAQKSLNSAYSSKGTKQLYNVYEGKLVKFQPDNAGGYHAYEVKNPSVEVPADVLRKMKNDGVISKAQYNKWIKNK